MVAHNCNSISSGNLKPSSDLWALHECGTYTHAGKAVIHSKVNPEKNEDDGEKEQSVCEVQLLGASINQCRLYLWGPSHGLLHP